MKAAELGTVQKHLGKALDAGFCKGRESLKLDMEFVLDEAAKACLDSLTAEELLHVLRRALEKLVP